MTEYVSEQYFIMLWLEKEPLLEPLYQWRDQYRKGRKNGQALEQEAEELKTVPPPPRLKPQWGAVVRETQERHAQLEAQHTACINDRAYARGDGAPPLPILSFAHLQLAFQYVDTLQARALTSPLVQDVVDSLQRIVQARDCDPVQDKKEWVSRQMRKWAQRLLQDLFALLIPPIKALTFMENTLEGHGLRFNMLGMYEYERARLADILGDKRIRRRDKQHRLAALREAYPAQSEQELERWFNSEPADVAEELVAQQYTSNREIVHKCLASARQERDPRLAARRAALRRR
jgi:hypothetical protein